MLGGGDRQRRRRAWLVSCAALLALSTLPGCGKGLAFALSPDFSGTWDVTYDDSLEVEVQLAPDQVVHDTITEQGGQLALQDASVSSELSVDCARPELVCPAEVWPRELALKSTPGQLDSEGVQLAQSLIGKGQGSCSARAGSLLTAEVVTVGTTHVIHPDAVALTSGRARIVVDAACFPTAGLPATAKVVLSAGFTAAKR